MRFSAEIGRGGAFIATASPLLHSMYGQSVTLSTLLYIL